MMGTPDENMLKEPAGDVDVLNDLDITEGEAVLDPRDNAENQKKVQQRLDKYDIKILNSPRPGKKLLVLDIGPFLWRFAFLRSPLPLVIARLYPVR